MTYHAQGSDRIASTMATTGFTPKHGCSRNGTQSQIDPSHDMTQRGWRPFLGSADRVWPAMFGRQQDCQRACDILNAVDVDGVPLGKIAKEILAHFGGLEALKRKIAEECCAW